MDPKKRELLDRFWAHQKVAKVAWAQMCLAIEIHSPVEAVIEHAAANADASKEADIVAHELNEAFPHRTINSIDDDVWTRLFETLAIKFLRVASRQPPPLTDEELAASRAAKEAFFAERRKRREAGTASPPQEAPPSTATEPDPEAK